MKRTISRVVVFVAVLVSAACDDFPKDPGGSLQTIQARHTIRIGVIEHRPWAHRTEAGPQGIEPDLVRAFARHLNVRPDWIYLPEAEAIQRLQRHEFDLVIGGLTAASPREKEVGLTRAYCRTGDGKQDQHVMAVPQGENGLMTALEKFLERHETDGRSGCSGDQGIGNRTAL